ncbi:MAG: hypothetical protein R3F55_15490 [Alphaproteobacteria bacterium]
MTNGNSATASVLGVLGKKLSDLADDEVLHIAALLERGGDDPQALKGRAILRQRLTVLRPRRRLNARRLFCVPFEMLLSDEQTPSDPVRRIARAGLLPAWQLVAKRLPVEVLNAAEAAAAEAKGIGDDRLQAPAEALWTAAADAIDAHFEQIASQVGDPQWLRDIGATLRACGPIAEIRALLQYPGRPQPSDEVGAQVAGILGGTQALGVEAVFATTLVAAAHFRAPGTVIGVLAANAFGVTPGPGQDALRRLCDVLGAGFERTLAALGREPVTDANAVVGSIAGLVDSLTLMRDFANKVKDPQMRLQVERALFEARSTTIDRVLPQMTGAVGCNLDRAVGEMVDGGSLEAAQSVEDNMVALARARPTAEVLGVGDEFAGSLATLLATVKAKAAEDVAGETADARGLRMMALARYVELLEGADAAQACLAAWLAAEAA